MSYLIGGVVPLSSNGLIEVPWQDSGGSGMQEWEWRDGGLPNEDGRLAVYVGETRGAYKVAGNPTDTPKPESMLVPAHRSPCESSPSVDWDSCIVGEGCKARRGWMYSGILVVVFAIDGL